MNPSAWPNSHTTSITFNFPTSSLNSVDGAISGTSSIRTASTSKDCAENTRQPGLGWAKVVRVSLSILVAAWGLAYAALFICWVDDQLNYTRAMESK